jgi:regulatory subunit for Cdc7p protein kinase
MFPQYVFYFESLPDEMRSRVSRQTHILGSREVKFFSREVTHVITTRTIPTEVQSTSTSKLSSTSQTDGAPRTVNPAAVEKTKLLFDAALQKGSTDILHRAREMGMKIWSAEKLERILTTMFDTETGEQPPDYSSRSRGSAAVQSKLGRQADLQKLLQNEKLNGPADRDFAAPTQEMVQLRGYYIYIHDMDELTRPVMIREYPKVANKEEGKWPQFRITGPGKCPFIEDHSHLRRAQQQQQEDKQKARTTSTAVPRTRAATALQANHAGRRALSENNNLAKRDEEVKKENAKTLDPPNGNAVKRDGTDNMPPMFGSAQASIRAMPRFVGGEPIASGIQPSNVTSAIQSQMISSTAAAPGARAGHSKEVNQLKRKVLEKNSVPSATNGQAAILNEMRAALNQECGPPTRAAKRKAQETLGQIKEDMTVEEEDRQSRKTVVIRRRKPAEKELKPGYCENCREKFNDFDEHTVSRKHRKFATSSENWRELDELLSLLVRY